MFLRSAIGVPVSATAIGLLWTQPCRSGPDPAPAPPVAAPAPIAPAPPIAAPAVEAPEVRSALRIDPARTGCTVDVPTDAATRLLATFGEDIAGHFDHAPTLDEVRSECLDRVPLPDLDGDGTADEEWTPRCGGWNLFWPHEVYVSDHGCPKFAGEMADAGLVVTGTARGMAVLEGTNSIGCAGHEFIWTKYQWNGTTYEAVDRAECRRCPDEWAPPPAPDANRHPRCKQGP